MKSLRSIKRTERGWAGHFCCAHLCRFRRNTLLECGDVRIIVSTVGLMEKEPGRGGGFEKIGLDRYFETMAFHAQWDGRYWDADVCRGELSFSAPWAIEELDADDKANDMHEDVVDEFIGKMIAGHIFQ